jgi:DNA-binding beta-propeller fold protein YncE
MNYFIQTAIRKTFFIVLSGLFVFGLPVQQAVAQTFQNGDVFVAISDGQVQWRNATGTLIQTLNTGQGGYTTGMAFDEDGFLYVTNFSANSVSVFNKSGVLQGTFGSGYSTPESIIFDAAGNAYVGNLGNGIRKFNSAGSYLSSSYTGRVDFLDLAADQCTMLRTTEGSTVARHNVCTNTALSDFATGLGGNAFALRVRQGGQVLLANGGNVLRLSSAGAVLQTYTVSGEGTWFALNLDPDGSSFWSANFGSANVYKIDIATGDVVTSFNTGTGGNTVFGLAVFGEVTVSNTYYSKASGDLHNVLTWGVNPDGTGTNPPDFSAGKTFNLRNRSVNYNMTANWTVGGVLNIPTGSQLRINGNTLSIAFVTGDGTISGSTTSNLTVTGGPNTLEFTSGSNSLNNFTVNVPRSAATTNVGNALNVYGTLTVNANGTLTTGGFLTLKSNAAGTARVAPVLGSISGNVTVERYVPARRAWRLLNAPVGGTQTIKAAWQEGAANASSNPNPGFGTHITGGVVYGTAANGFDLNTAALSKSYSSIKSFNNATGKWDSVANTNSITVGNKPYMLFVRGDRSIPLSGPDVPANNTVLRAKGSLKTGDQTFSVGASGFTSVPNPFASPFDFHSITRTNVPDKFYVWDPKLGGTNGVGAFVNVSWNGSSYDITPTPVSAISRYIQSGQSFMIQSNGSAGSLVVKETDKSATAAADVFDAAEGDNRQVSAMRLRTEPAQGLKLNLQTDEGDSKGTLDGVFLSYGKSFSNSIDDMDVLKLDNIEENLAMIRDGQALMVERRTAATAQDAIQLKLWNVTQRSYLLDINPINLSATGLYVYLKDNYLRTTTLIDVKQATQIPFIVTSDEASANPNRFTILLATTKLQPEGLADGITIFPNPIKGRTISLRIINQPEGTYQVSLVNGLGQIVQQERINHTGGSSVQSVQLRSKLAKGVYQLNVSRGGEKTILKLLSE